MTSPAALNPEQETVVWDGSDGKPQKIPIQLRLKAAIEMHLEATLLHPLLFGYPGPAPCN